MSPRQKIVLDHLQDLGCNVRVLRGSDAVAAYLLEAHDLPEDIRPACDQEVGEE